MGCLCPGQVTNGSGPGSPSGPRSPDRQRAGGPGESSGPEGERRRVCGVSAGVGSADASLVVAFVCKVNRSAAPLGSVGNLLSPSPPSSGRSSTPRKETSWFLRPGSWGCPCKCPTKPAGGAPCWSAAGSAPFVGPQHVVGRRSVFAHHGCSPIRGTAAIGPLIAALKNGRSVTHEGREVRRRLAVA